MVHAYIDISIVSFGAGQTQRGHAFTRKTGSLFGLRLNLQHDVSSRVWHMFIVPKKKAKKPKHLDVYLWQLFPPMCPRGPCTGLNLPLIMKIKLDACRRREEEAESAEEEANIWPQPQAEIPLCLALFFFLFTYSTSSPFESEICIPFLRNAGNSGRH